ncbi:MAG: hydroxysqualene dehydroxylase HpnE [Betaproteobacteria bacterium]|nr:hydroxysqualene dehydroxylase HpnE [Betaproteobacteria bacterium]
MAIVGGGYAGMAAAVTLAAAGRTVHVLEAGRRLGGRARATDLQDLTLDNGQHILIGAYAETLRLIDTVWGTRQNARRTHPGYLRLPFELSMAGEAPLRAWPLPAPFHLLGALLGARTLPLRERLAAIRFIRQMQRCRFRLPEDASVGALLARHGQLGKIAEILWEPLCVAALNTPVPSASARVFLTVLRDGLAGHRTACDLILPRVDLSALFPDRAAQYVAARGGEVSVSTPVRRIEAVDGAFRILCDRQTVTASHVILAVPPYRMPGLAATLPGMDEAIGGVRALSFEPIYTIYLQYAPSVHLPRPMLGFVGSPIHWLFDRAHTGPHPGLLAAVISARGAHETLDHETLAGLVHREIATHLGGLPQPRWHKVIAEKRATFSCTVGVRRPAQETGLPRFYLAGDYTAGEYPGTLEAAVRSGVQCAHHALND